MPAALATSGVLLRVRLAKKGESDMTFIKTVPEAEASGAVATLYDEDRDTFGRQPAHQVIDFRLGADIDSAGRLVEQNQPRLERHPFRQHDFLLVASA